MKQMNRTRTCRIAPRRQMGAAVVEFAFVFPLLFLLTYGTIVYGYVFMLQEALTFTAQQSAAAAVAVDPAKYPTVAGARAQMTTIAQATAVQSLIWLGTTQSARVVGTGGEKVQVTFCNKGNTGCPTDTDAISVKMIFDLKVPTPLFPVLSFGGMMGLGSIPPMPNQLVAQATVRI